MQENDEIVSYIKRAFELKSQNCYKQAIEMLYKALEIESENLEILFQVGELYFLLHNYERAKQYLERVLENDENHVPSLKVLSKIQERENLLSEATINAKKVYEITKEEEDFSRLVNLYGKSGEIDEIEKVLQNGEISTNCRYECANALYQNKKIEKAKEVLTTIDVENSENRQAKILLGKIYFDENNLEKSKEIFDSFDKNVQDPEILNYKGLFALDEMNFVEAIKDFSKAANLVKTNAIYYYNLANAYFFNGWQQEAVDAYKKAIANAPENLDFKYSLAYLYFEMKEFDKTKNIVENILSQNSKHSQARVLLALLKLQKKDYLGSKEILEENVKEGNEDNFTLISLGKVYKELNMYEKAAKTIKDVIDKSPENLSYLSDLAEVYVKEKQYDKALELAKEVIEKNERYIYAYIVGANAAYLKDDLEQTKEFAQEALSLDINCGEGYYYLALAREKENDFDEAIECMKRAITSDVNNAKYYAEMSNIYRAKNDLKTAFEYIKEAESIEHSTEYQIIYKELATLSRKSK